MIPKRVVLDTNVCLDLFVFRDPCVDALMHALQTGAIHAMTREDCRTEWHIVLGYPHLKLDEARRKVTQTLFDALIALSPPALSTHQTGCLPTCKDQDDQKFLECAYEQKVDFLLTKDKALLKLARKTRRAGLFDIMTPQTWMTRHATSD